MEMLCPNCQRPNSPGAQFCRHCAASLALGDPQQQQQQAPPFTPPGPSAWGQQQQSQTWNQGGGGMQGGGGGYVQQTGAQAGASGRAIASFVLAVCGLVLCCGLVTGVPAAILGWLEMSAIKEGRSSPKGMWMAQVGLWGGIAVSVVITILNFLMLIPMLFSGSF